MKQWKGFIMYIQDSLVDDEFIIKSNIHGFFTEYPQFGRVEKEKEYRIIIVESDTELGDDTKVSSDDISNYWYKRYLKMHRMLQYLKQGGVKIDFKNIEGVE